MDVNDLDQPLAQRRGCQLPKRHRDTLPVPLPLAAPLPLPPLHLNPVLSVPLSSQEVPAAASVGREPLSAFSSIRKVLKSTHNVFGLFRQYHTTYFPEHDPDQSVTVDDLTNTLPDTNLLIDYHPYPNQSSFLLGEWY